MCRSIFLCKFRAASSARGWFWKCCAKMLSQHLFVQVSRSILCKRLVSEMLTRAAPTVHCHLLARAPWRRHMLHPVDSGVRALLSATPMALPLATGSPPCIARMSNPCLRAATPSAADSVGMAFGRAFAEALLELGRVSLRCIARVVDGSRCPRCARSMAAMGRQRSRTRGATSM